MFTARNSLLQVTWRPPESPLRCGGCECYGVMGGVEVPSTPLHTGPLAQITMKAFTPQAPLSTRVIGERALEVPSSS